MKTFRVYVIQTAMAAERGGRGAKVLRGGNLTITYLAALCPAYCEVRVCDETYQDVDYTYDADIVAMSALTCSANHAYEIAARFKKEKGTWTVMGGSHATVCPEECLEHVDSVCIGEGDRTFPLLVESVYQTGKAERIYQNAQPIDLAKLPHPRRELLDRRGVYLHGVQMTRGCRYSCDFCFIRRLYGSGVRTRPVDDVIEEIEETIAGNKFSFWDDSIVASREAAYELFTKLTPLRKRWISQCNLDLADDPPLLAQAANSGCAALFLGIESFNERVLRSMKKGFNKAVQYKDRIQALHDHGIFVACGVVFGSDEDDPFVFERSLEAIDYVGIDAVSATINTPMPGTDLTNRLLAEGRIFDLNWDHYDYRHVVFRPKKMTEEQLAEGHGWFYNNFYRLPHIARRLFRDGTKLEMPLFYQLVIALGYRHTARNTCRRGLNPAACVVDGVQPPAPEAVDPGVWSHGARLGGA